MSVLGFVEVFRQGTASAVPKGRGTSGVLTPEGRGVVRGAASDSVSILLRGTRAAIVFAAIAAIILATSPHGHAQNSAIHFEDVTRAAGIKFVNNSGAFGQKWLPETMGSGVAFLDYDNDGCQDILIVNGMDWPGHVRRHSTLALYHK